MNVRAQATGMASQTQNIAQAIFGQFFPTFLNKTGFACFFFFMVINIILAFFVWLVVPETKGVALEEMDALFGGVNHVAGGAELMDMRKEDVMRVESVGDIADGRGGKVGTAKV
jgi:hypothetical protein